jgi:hypothetical protein
MIDFASLPQKDEHGEWNEEEKAISTAGLESIAAMYASPRVAVIQHKNLSGDKVRRPYDKSGWCSFEQAVASLATMCGGMLYDANDGRRKLLPGSQKSVDEMVQWFRDSDVHFYGNADRDKVVNSTPTSFCA